jgi:cytosol alanyl aminopeptidase
MIKLRTFAALLLVFFLSAATVPATYAQTAQPAPKPPGLQLGDEARPVRYALDLTIKPSAEAFMGTVDIDIDLRKATSFVWLNSKKLAIRHATIVFGRETLVVRLVPGDDETVGFAFEKPLGPGPAHLRLVYSGLLNAVDTEAIFREKYGDDWYVFTQFEDTFARRAFPCFDEPGFKVPWQLTIRAPQDQVVIANTSAVSTTEEPNGMKVVRFAETKPLPSYLVAFAVGPFDVVDAGTAGRNRTPLRIIAPRGRGAETKFAAETTPKFLELLEEFFDTPYPYDKLDQIAIPITYGFGAMENAGLITYEQGILLARPEYDTPARQSSFAYTASHEIAHQWFGDLVTMRWWDDLWLNEGFATWMEGKIIERWKPELEPRVGEVWSKSSVMSSDSLLTARRVREPIQSRDDIANAFDSITYQKGAAVLRMFEAWLDPDVFRDGVRRYLKAHAWGNATTADFASALGAASGQKLASAFSSFVDQPGVPVVTAELKCAPGSKPRLVLTQKRYVPVGSSGAKQQTWQIPIYLRYDSDVVDTEDLRFIMNSPTLEVPIDFDAGCPDWLIANAHATGYYHVLYKGDLLKRLLDNVDKLTVPERVGLVSDLQSLVRSGDLPVGEALALVPRLLRDPNPYVKAGTVGLHSSLGQRLPDDLLPSYARFLGSTYGDTARKLGWQPGPNDDEGTRTLRASLVNMVAEEGNDPVLVAEAKRLALKWLDDPATVDSDTAGKVLHVAARNGDAALFERMRAEAEKTRDMRRRSLLFFGLGSFRDPVLLKKAFALTLADTFDTRESVVILLAANGDRTTRDLAYDFLKQNYDALTARLPKDFAAQLVYFGASYCDPVHKADVESFFKSRIVSAAGGSRNLAQVLEGIDLCAAQQAANAAEVTAFLRGY